MAPLHSFSNASLTAGTPAVRAGARAARLGYVSRAVECRHVSDVHAGPDVVDALPDHLMPSGTDAPAGARQIMQAAARLAAPAPRGGHDGASPLSLVPGLDPTARSEIASAVLHDAAPTNGCVDRADLERAWTYGFLVHVMSEVATHERQR